MPDWEREALDELCDVLGIAIVLFGFLLRIAARGYKAERSSGGHKIVTDGPYGLVRHPMYAGTFLVITGVILLLFKWWVFLLLFAVFLLIYIPQINKEERVLRKRSDTEYKAYFENTPKYFPNIIELFKTNPRKYLLFKWSWAQKEIVSLVITFSLIIAIETWQDIGLFGSDEFFKELLELLSVTAAFIGIIIFYNKQNDDRAPSP